MRLRFLALLAALAATGACSRSTGSESAASSASAAPMVPAAGTRPATFPPEWRFKAGAPRGRVAEHAMVASINTLASEAGAEIMRKGGNAVDAAVATGFALAVTYPAAGNIGGGGFMVIHMADGRAAAMDYREVAPLAASRDMYLDANGKLTDKSLVGHLAVGVPGAVAGMAEALARYGTMSLKDAMAPAIRLASEGFLVDSALSRSLTSDRAKLIRFADAPIFFPGGTALAPGTRLVQTDLARTLRLIADQGPNAFYQGEIADLLVAEMRRGGGIITKQDLANYKPLWREPIRGTYRGYSLFTMPPSSSGGITMIETLNVLEGYDPMPPFGSARYAHLLTEAFRRAFVDRNTRIGDPAFVKVPVEQLTSKAYATVLRGTIEPGRATPSPAFAERAEPMHTTHYSVVDARGNAVATTTTLNGGYGSGSFVTGGGFFLNNEMDDFAAQPGKPNQFGLVQGEVNAIAPGKRMLSAMAPTIVLDPRGKLLLVVGAAGGPTIITATAQIILNVIDGHMSLPDAMAAPRIHHQAWPDSLRFERMGLTLAVQDSLKAMGYNLWPIGSLATANAVMRVPGGYHGVSEPRSTGGAAGY